MWDLINKLEVSAGPVDAATVAQIIAAGRGTTVESTRITRGDGGEDELVIFFADGNTANVPEGDWPDRSIEAALALIPLDERSRPCDIKFRVTENGKAHYCVLSNWLWGTLNSGQRGQHSYAKAACIVGLKAINAARSCAPIGHHTLALDADSLSA